jgi:hypothetical protein
MIFELPHTNFYIDKNGILYYDDGIVIQDFNPLHQAYLKWLEEGNEPEEWTNAD